MATLNPHFDEHFQRVAEDLGLTDDSQIEKLRFHQTFSQYAGLLQIEDLIGTISLTAYTIGKMEATLMGEVIMEQLSHAMAAYEQHLLLLTWPEGKDWEREKEHLRAKLADRRLTQARKAGQEGLN